MRSRSRTTTWVNVLGATASLTASLIVALVSFILLSRNRHHAHSPPSTGCVAWWCPCIVYGQNKTRLEYLDKTGQAHPDGGESFGNDCLIHGLLTCCGGWGWILQVRTPERRSLFLTSADTPFIPDRSATATTPEIATASRAAHSRTASRPGAATLARSRRRAASSSSRREA